MTQGRVEFLPPFNASQRSELASALGMSESDFADLPIQVVTTGHSKVMVPMLSRSTLDGLTPNNEKLKAMSAEIGCNGFSPLSWKVVSKNLLLMVECSHPRSVLMKIL